MDVEWFQESGQTGCRCLRAAGVDIVAPPCGPWAVIPVNEGMEEIVGGHLHLPVECLPDVVEHQDSSRVVGVGVRVERDGGATRLDTPTVAGPSLGWKGLPVRIEERIGVNLRAAREANGWSQEALGERVGGYLGRPWSAQTVSVAEKGGRDFDAEDMLVLALVFGRPVAWFYRDQTPKTAGQEIELPSGFVVTEASMRRVYGLENAEAYRIAIEMEKLAAQVRLLGEGES
jgi:transcriptional regulator with XRE-family HTH domain